MRTFKRLRWRALAALGVMILLADVSASFAATTATSTERQRFLALFGPGGPPRHYVRQSPALGPVPVGTVSASRGTSGGQQFGATTGGGQQSGSTRQYLIARQTFLAERRQEHQAVLHQVRQLRHELQAGLISPQQFQSVRSALLTSFRQDVSRLRQEFRQASTASR